MKPVPATRTPKLKKKEIKEPQPIEPVKAEEVRTEPPVKDSEPLIAEKAPAELQAEPRTYLGNYPLNGTTQKYLMEALLLCPQPPIYRLVTFELIPPLLHSILAISPYMNISTYGRRTEVSKTGRRAPFQLP